MQIYLIGFKYNVDRLPRLAQKKIMERAGYNQPFKDAIRAVFDSRHHGFHVANLRDEMASCILKQGWKIVSSPSYVDFRQMMQELPLLNSTICMALLREHEQGYTYGSHFVCKHCHTSHRLIATKVAATPLCLNCDNLMVLKETFHQEQAIVRPRY